eukprot:m51a1_g7274 putative adp-ribosylation factor-like protein 6 (984) ;mRNA; f:233358-239229
MPALHASDPRVVALLLCIPVFAIFSSVAALAFMFVLASAVRAYVNRRDPIPPNYGRAVTVPPPVVQLHNPKPPTISAPTPVAPKPLAPPEPQLPAGQAPVHHVPSAPPAAAPTTPAQAAPAVAVPAAGVPSAPGFAVPQAVPQAADRYPVDPVFASMAPPAPVVPAPQAHAGRERWRVHLIRPTAGWRAEKDRRQRHTVAPAAAGATFPRVDPPWLERVRASLVGRAVRRVLGCTARAKSLLAHVLWGPGETVPTVGFQIEEFSKNNINFTVVDMSGAGRYRNLWEHYYSPSSAVIFVVDSSDRFRVVVAKDELDCMLAHKNMKKNVPLLVYANKMDVKEALSGPEVARLLDLDKIHDHPFDPRVVALLLCIPVFAIFSSVAALAFMFVLACAVRAYVNRRDPIPPNYGRAVTVPPPVVQLHNPKPPTISAPTPVAPKPLAPPEPQLPAGQAPVHHVPSAPPAAAPTTPAQAAPAVAVPAAGVPSAPGFAVPQAVPQAADRYPVDPVFASMAPPAPVVPAPQAHAGRERWRVHLIRPTAGWRAEKDRRQRHTVAPAAAGATFPRVDPPWLERVRASLVGRAVRRVLGCTARAKSLLAHVLWVLLVVRSLVPQVPPADLSPAAATSAASAAAAAAAKLRKPEGEKPVAAKQVVAKPEGEKPVVAKPEGEKPVAAKPVAGKAAQTQARRMAPRQPAAAPRVESPEETVAPPPPCASPSPVQPAGAAGVALPAPGALPAASVAPSSTAIGAQPAASYAAAQAPASQAVAADAQTLTGPTSAAAPSQTQSKVAEPVAQGQSATAAPSQTKDVHVAPSRGRSPSPVRPINAPCAAAAPAEPLALVPAPSPAGPAGAPRGVAVPCPVADVLKTMQEMVLMAESSNMTPEEAMLAVAEVTAQHGVRITAEDLPWLRAHESVMSPEEMWAMEPLRLQQLALFWELKQKRLLRAFLTSLREPSEVPALPAPEEDERKPRRARPGRSGPPAAP